MSNDKQPYPLPRIGDIVHFHFDADEDVREYNHQRVHPAMVVAVHGADCVNLKVIPDGKIPCLWETSVTRSEIREGKITRGFTTR